MIPDVTPPRHQNCRCSLVALPAPLSPAGCPEADPVFRDLCAAHTAATGDSPEALATRRELRRLLFDRLNELGFPAAAWEHFGRRDFLGCGWGGSCGVIAIGLGDDLPSDWDTLAKVEAQCRRSLGRDWKRTVGLERPQHKGD